MLLLPELFFPLTYFLCVSSLILSFSVISRDLSVSAVEYHLITTLQLGVRVIIVFPNINLMV